MAHTYMPISISVRNRPCLVVGGGTVALRKVETLMDYETSIMVIAPAAHEKLKYHASRNRISLDEREYRSPEAEAYGLVISASDDSTVNMQVYADSRNAGVPVNVVDDPAHCDFIFPAVLRRDCLTVALSTDGHAPFMAGHLRLVLDNVFPIHWSRLMKLATSFRIQVKERWADDTSKKNVCYAEFLEADWKSLLKEMSDQDIEAELTRMVELPG